MARKLRLEFEGAIHHVTVRGVERRRIFDDDADRERFVMRLGEAVEEYGVRLYLYTLMSNHGHLLCETPKGNLGSFMHKLQTAYTVYYNLRHRRAGHLMQGRYGAVPVSGDEYLQRLSRYIHLNPVYVRNVRNLPLRERVERLNGYEWSSYRRYAGCCKGGGFVDEGPILAFTGGSGRKGREGYRRFVEAGLTDTDEEFCELLKSARWGIGGEEFQAQVRDMHAEQSTEVRRPEDVSFRRQEPQLSCEEVLDAVGKVFGVPAQYLRRRQYGCEARAVAALMLGRYTGMNQRDAGVYLGMGTGSAVSRQLKRLRGRRVQNRPISGHTLAVQEILNKYVAQRISNIKG
jgi:REP element-mobilizing transposase RayT